MYAHLPGDFEPCDDCKSKGVCLYESQETACGRKETTGRLWLVQDDGVRRMFADAPKFVKSVLELRYGFIPKAAGDVVQAVFDQQKAAQEARDKTPDMEAQA